jgi:hypothetical protein
VTVGPPSGVVEQVFMGVRSSCEDLGVASSDRNPGDAPTELALNLLCSPVERRLF